ncbi:MAG: hypothetical protein MJZ89_00295 [Paludibacteraceae bacterium]|nr:hypothetical protein [Paludibacteraceae bacterium]
MLFMAEIENIGKRDVLWSYAATAFTIGAGLLLLPFMLNRMSSETIGIWSLYQTVIMLVIMLDFGFRPTFARNVSYILSGVRQLKAEGIARDEDLLDHVDYALLKGALLAMRRFYRWLAMGVFAMLATIGTLYFRHVFADYPGNQTDAWISWVLLIAGCTWDLYTYYYDALLTGKGYIRQQQQITIIGQGLYVLLAIALIFMGGGLSAVVAARLVSTIVRRYMARKTFFTQPMLALLANNAAADTRQVMTSITPNAIKLGLVSLGGFVITRSATLLGGLLMPLDTIASLGITMQVVDIIARCAQVYAQSYMPKVAQYRVEQNKPQLRHLYTLSTMALVGVFVAGGCAFVLLGNWALDLIHSQTHFLATPMLLAILGIQLLEQNHSLSALFIAADNTIPFFIPSLLSAAGTLILLFVFMYGFPQMGIWGLILAPGIAQLCYQNWKWPSVILRELYL